MDNLLALLLWLTGGTPPQEPPAPNDPIITTQGGGIPIQPGKIDDTVN